MELVWYGGGCFRITERGYPAVITDPFADNDPNIILPRSLSEIVTSSKILDYPRLARWGGVPGVQHTIAGPGEYEIGGVFITGVASYRKKTKNALFDNVIYTIDQGGVVACHFGECGLVPTQSQVEILGHINVLLIPVGLSNGLSSAMASEIVSMIEPDIVIPTHYALPDQTSSYKAVQSFLKVMGIETPTVSASLKVEPNVISSATRVILLEQTL
jgi:L-ascorbate metabolism protein UlaG (beta-lactamase superfamily)